MTQKPYSSMSSLGYALKAMAEAAFHSLASRRIVPLLGVICVAASCLAAGSQTSTYVPAVISSSVSPVPTTMYANPTGNMMNLMQPTNVALDACGNIYTLDAGYSGNTPILEIPAGGGAPTVAFTSLNRYDGSQLGQDASHKSLIVPLAYSTGVDLVPLTNCVAQGSQAKLTGNSGSGALFYYYDPFTGAGDFAGNTYVTSQSTCCVTGSYYLVQSVGGVGGILLSNTANLITSITIDTLQNVYYISGSAVYELPYSNGKYAAAPVPFGQYLNPVGVSVDFVGNLYVADSSAGAIYEIPNEGTTGPNLADQFTVSTGLSVNVAAAVNARGDMYYTAAGAKVVSELTLGNANFNTVALGQSATRVLNFQFNRAVTITKVQMPAGDFTTQPANVGTTNCTTAAYGPGGTTNCQITVAYTPTVVGKESSAVVLTYTTAGPVDKNGNPTTITTTTSGFVEGIGQGALLTLDPGVPVTAAGSFRSPAGVAIDRAGNTFVADAGNNSVTEYPVGGGAAIPIAIQSGSSGVSTALSAPLGVAVDGTGDVFIADTGNNRVVEVPYANGALNPAGSTVVASGLKNPSGVFVHTNGDLYVADTGDNTILVYPSFNGPTNAGNTFGAATKLGTGLSAPLAVTVDGMGDVFIADSGNNQILEYPLGGGQEIVAADILNPSGLATDSSGSLFVVDQGNFRVLRIPSIAGTLNPNSAAEVALGVVAPYGVAVDASSNLYVTDKTSAALYTIPRAQAGLNFGAVAVGSTSNALPLTVESAGNVPLIFNQPYFLETGNSTDFAMTSPTGACADGITLGTGSSCDLSTVFKPSAAGPRSATVSFSSNAANTPQVVLSGTGVTPSPTTTTLALATSVAGAPFYGEPLSLTATIAPTSGSGVPTGVVSFVLDGTQIGLEPLVKGVATLPLNSGLTGGTHTAYAVYKGDTNDNGSSSASQTISISRAPTTAALVVTKIPFNNPYSLRHSNAGSCTVTDNSGNANAFPAIVSDGIGFMASVTSPGVGVPSGTLTFYSDGMPINGVQATGGPAVPTSIAPLLPASGGVFSGNMTSDANTLGDGTLLGENNVLLGPHVITVVYSGDQNYLPTTSAGTLVTVTDVSPTTPVTLPQTPNSPAPYCDATSPITGSRPSDPGTYQVATSSSTITASANAPGTVTMTFSSLSGWTGTIEVACANLPQYATCSALPGQITLNASTPGSTSLSPQAVLTITTNVPPYVPTAGQSRMFWLTPLLLGLLTLANRRLFRRARTGLKIASVLGAIILFAGMGALSGCGTSATSSVVTKPGTYPITVTLTGAQTDPQEQSAHEVFRSDVPYTIPFTLTVK